MPEFEDYLDNNNFFNQYMLEVTPSLAYFSAAPFQGQTSAAQRQYWSGQFGNVTNQYMGALGTAIRAGQEGPSFTRFLEDMPWTEKYTALSPRLRPGSDFRRFSPQTRYMYQ